MFDQNGECHGGSVNGVKALECSNMKMVVSCCSGVLAPAVLGVCPKFLE